MILFESGTLVSGHITTVDTVRLDGKLEGSITCPRLEIGPDGYLLGDAEVEEIVVLGQVVGTIRARSVAVGATALVEGEIHHETLVIEEAGVLVGRSIRGVAQPLPALVELRRRGQADRDEIDETERLSMRRQARAARRVMPAYQELRARMFA